MKSPSCFLFEPLNPFLSVRFLLAYQSAMPFGAPDPMKTVAAPFMGLEAPDESGCYKNFGSNLYCKDFLIQLSALS